MPPTPSDTTPHASTPSRNRRSEQPAEHAGSVADASAATSLGLLLCPLPNCTRARFAVATPARQPCGRRDPSGAERPARRRVRNRRDGAARRARRRMPGFGWQRCSDRAIASTRAELSALRSPWRPGRSQIGCPCRARSRIRGRAGGSCPTVGVAPARQASAAGSRLKQASRRGDRFAPGPAVWSTAPTLLIGACCGRDLG